MNKFGTLRSQAKDKFGSDPNHLAIAERGLDFLEDWTKETQYGDGTKLNLIQRWKKKRECQNYITAKLYEAREKEYGFLGALLTAVAFQILVQIIVKWIMANFFE